MKSFILISMFIASSVFANPFSKFMGTYAPAGNVTEKVYGTNFCQLHDFKGMTEFTIDESNGYLGYVLKGKIAYSNSLTERQFKTQRFQEEIYIRGSESQATRTENIFDYFHNEYRSSALTISELPNGKYHLKYVNFATKGIDNLSHSCSVEIDVVRK